MPVLHPGTRLGPYEILGLIGAGGAGWRSSRTSPVGAKPTRSRIPGPGPRVQVSIDGANNVFWHPSGRQLFFSEESSASSPHNKMMSVDVRSTPALSIGRPRVLFEFNRFDVALGGCFPLPCESLAPDGLHFYTLQTVTFPERPTVTHLNLVQNWVEELTAKVPSGR